MKECKYCLDLEDFEEWAFLVDADEKDATIKFKDKTEEEYESGRLVLETEFEETIRVAIEGGYGSLEISLLAHDGEEYTIKRKINYCPMCGRKLIKRREEYERTRKNKHSH